GSAGEGPKPVHPGATGSSRSQPVHCREEPFLHVVVVADGRGWKHLHKKRSAAGRRADANWAERLLCAAHGCGAGILDSAELGGRGVWPFRRWYPLRGHEIGNQRDPWHGILLRPQSGAQRGPKSHYANAELHPQPHLGWHGGRAHPEKQVLYVLDV